MQVCPWPLILGWLLPSSECSSLVCLRKDSFLVYRLSQNLHLKGWLGQTWSSSSELFLKTVLQPGHESGWKWLVTHLVSMGTHDMKINIKMHTIEKTLKIPSAESCLHKSENALARVQRVNKPADLWGITFCTRWFWGPVLFYRTDCTRRSKFLTHVL